MRLLGADGSPAVVDAGALDALARVPGWSSQVRRAVRPHAPSRGAASAGPRSGSDDAGAPGRGAQPCGRLGPGGRAQGRPYGRGGPHGRGVAGALPRCRPWARPAAATCSPGVIASLLGQGLLPGDAAALGVYLHGRAAERLDGRAGRCRPHGHGPAGRAAPGAARAARRPTASRRPGMSIAPVPPRHRGAWLEVDLDALRHNARLLRALGGAAALAPVVKANAYGHGLAAVARGALRDRRGALRGHARRGHRGAARSSGVASCCSTPCPRGPRPTPWPAVPS